MFKLLAAAACAALVAACAAAPAGNPSDPMRERPGSSTSGASKAADLGFHGPVYREKASDGPN